MRILSAELVKVKPVYLFSTCVSSFEACPQWVVLVTFSSVMCGSCVALSLSDPLAPFLP